MSTLLLTWMADYNWSQLLCRFKYSPNRISQMVIRFINSLTITPNQFNNKYSSISIILSPSNPSHHFGPFVLRFDIYLSSFIFFPFPRLATGGQLLFLSFFYTSSFFVWLSTLGFYCCFSFSFAPSMSWFSVFSILLRNSL